MKIAPPPRFIAALLLALLAAGPALGQMPAARLTTGDWAPYVERGSEGHGQCARVVTAVLHAMGLRPEYVFLPWKQAQEEAERSASNAGYRGTFPYVSTPERERLFYFSEPIFETAMVVFYNAAHHPELARVERADELRGLTAVVAEGYAHPSELERVMDKVEEEKNELHAFRRLIEDPKVHYLPAARRVGEEMLARNFAARSFDVEVIPGLSWKSDLHLLASRRNPYSWQFIQDFDAALAELRHSGALEQLQRDPDRSSTASDVVELTTADGQWIAAHDPDRPERQLALAAGTRAAVLRWGPAYTGPRAGTIDAAARACRIRLLSGPARGQTVEVDGRFLRLVTAQAH